MAATCTHPNQIRDLMPRGDGCKECQEMGDDWVHAIIQSFEPGVDWYWCYPDELTFELEA